MFLPFDLNENYDNPLSNSDPDPQFYNEQCNTVLNSCDYYLEDTLNTKLDKLNVNENSFSMIHLNIRSAAQNLSKFESYLSNLIHTFKIVALSENWLKQHNQSLFDLDGYQAEHRYRSHKGGGGVSLFIDNSMEYYVREDLCEQSNNVESLFVEINKTFIGKNQDAIVGVLYRPPNTDMKAFNEYLNSILLKTKAEKKLLYILADFNINLLNADGHGATQDFLDIMCSNSLLPTITKPTRVTKNSATLIDNIFTNGLLGAQYILTYILYCDITDHLPVFYIDYSSNTKSEETFIKKRIYSESNITSFSSALRSHNWDHVLSDGDPQSSYSMFINDYMKIYNSSFPIKSFKQGYKTRKGWLSDNLKNAIKIKNRLYRKHNKSQNPEHCSFIKDFETN